MRTIYYPPGSFAVVSSESCSKGIIICSKILPPTFHKNTKAAQSPMRAMIWAIVDDRRLKGILYPDDGSSLFRLVPEFWSFSLFRLCSRVLTVSLLSFSHFVAKQPSSKLEKSKPWSESGPFIPTWSRGQPLNLFSYLIGFSWSSLNAPIRATRIFPLLSYPNSCLKETGTS